MKQEGPHNWNDRPGRQPLSSPYGPQPETVDEASGGADSSPFETMSSEERHAALGRHQPDQQAGDPKNQELRP
jgi:hypothetical protein